MNLITTDNPQGKEIVALRAEIQALTQKLTTALSIAEAQAKRADELVLELEIWKPSDKKE